MLSIIGFAAAPEQIEIVADAAGIDDLISYLEGIKRDKDHMHLLVGNELGAYPIPLERQAQVYSLKSVRLQYEEQAFYGSFNQIAAFTLPPFG